MKKILHVGCGPTPLPDEFSRDEWQEIRYDIDPDVNPDVIGNINDLSAFGAQEIDAIYCAHNIEHLYIHDMYEALKEFHRVLRPEGHLYIICPDIQTLGRYIAEGHMEAEVYHSEAGPISVADLLWGYKGHLAAGMEYMSHKYGFSASTMNDWLATAGFESRLIGRRIHACELCVIASPVAGTYIEVSA
jgi:SAM-dependent methyltransferase